MDLFKREQHIYDEAAAHLKEIQDGAPCCAKKFAQLTEGYGKLLRQFRRLTKLSDKTAGNLNTHKIDLHHQSRHDALTGIYNRRFMEETLPGYIASLADSNGGLSVLMIDIDFFKKYNDTYGHGMGDDCLKAVANAIAGGIRGDGSFAARYGGEEFIVVLSDTDAEGAQLAAERLLERVQKLRIPHAKSDVASFVTVSIGIAAGIVDNRSDANDFIKLADEALYISKQRGRNRFTRLNLQRDPQ